MATNVILKPLIVSFSDGSGAALSLGNAEVSGEARVTPRRIIGDNNANQRIDIGDATVISRLQVGLEERRPWDIGLNDLNNTKDLDIGDTVKALRIVVGMDGQPSQMVEAKRVSMPLDLTLAPVSTNYSTELFLLDGPMIQKGRPYRVAVRLKSDQSYLTGLTFALKYPAGLELIEKAVATSVPYDALPVWNVIGNWAKLAIVRHNPWAVNTGTVAVFTFEANAAAMNQAGLPFSLEEVEVNDVAKGLTAIPGVLLEIGGSLDSVPQLKVVSHTGGRLALEIRGPQGLSMTLEASGNLDRWTEVQQINGQGESTPSQITFDLDPNDQAKFWRVRVR